LRLQLFPAILLVAHAFAQSGEPDAIVLSQPGGWSHFDGSPVTVWQRIPAGTKLICHPNNSDALDYVSNSSAGKLNCSISPIAIPRTPSSPSGFFAVVAAILNGKEGVLPVPAAVRGFRSPLDAALSLNAKGQVSLGPALASLNFGRYHLDFLPFEESTRQVLASADVKWDRGTDEAVAIPRLNRGLYRLQALTDDGDEEVGTWAAILVAPEPVAAEANRKIREVREGEGKDLSELGKRALAIAILAAASDKTAGNRQ
jgi:hypothetical protein